jgi:hypothetical protein
MARQVNQALWDQWRKRLQRQKASGLSIAEFCRKENLSRQGFHLWKRKLPQVASRRQASRQAGAAGPLRKRRGGGHPSGASHGRASPAIHSLPRGFLQLPVAATRSSPWSELALADGTVIRLPQQNVAALVAVLRVLRGDPAGVMSGECGDA